MLHALATILLLLSQPAVSCADIETCKAEALIAHARGDFEAFHDFAWAAYRKGKPNNPELMMLVARAQSVSGRPGDAITMLQRVIALGAPVGDVETDPDFARARAIPQWAGVREKLTAAAAAPPTPASPPSTPPVTRTTPPEPKPPVVMPETRPKELPLPPKPRAVPTKPEPEPVPKAPAPAKPPEPAPVPKRDPGEPLKFTTPLAPSALAYDAVSKRFIIADRRARRIAVVDENTGNVDTLVGSLGALGDVEGIAIDAQAGDLWAVTTAAEGPRLHKTQLISGRVLSTTAISGLESRPVAVTFVRGVGLVAADGTGILWRIRESGRAERLAALEYVPKVLAADGNGGLLVSAGGPRLGRFTVVPFRKTGVVELHDGVSSDAPFIVASGRLLTLIASDGGYEIRGTAIK